MYPMPVPVSLSFPAVLPPRPSSSSPVPAMKRPRPRGLWKARGTGPRFSATDNLLDRQVAPAAPFRTLSTTTAHTDSDDDSEPHGHSDGDDADLDDDDDDDDNDDDCSSTSSKRRRTNPVTTPASSEEGDVFFWDYARKCSTESDDPPEDSDHTPTSHNTRSSSSSWTTRTKIMDISSTAGAGTVSSENGTCDLEDWEDLKELFGKAIEQYETEEPDETLPLLRGVIHECHRFLMFYHDPSVLFCPPRGLSAGPRSPPEDAVQYYELKEWAGFPPTDKVHARTKPVLAKKSPPKQPQHTPELPTAFHALFGTALFLFGNLIAQDPSFALEGEPASPTAYWLAALDVFETGENLPARTSGHELGGSSGSAPAEDWRMAVVWGRTLVCLADEVVGRLAKAKEEAEGASPASLASPPSSPPNANATVGMGMGMPTHVGAGQFSADEPKWPPESPFSAIAARRPPVTRRMSLASATPNDLLVLAMDQFSRGIFHMPHASTSQQGGCSSSATPVPPPLTQTNSTASSSTASSSATASSSKSTSDPHHTYPTHPYPFSRAKELYTLASEVLLVAEKLPFPSERQYWAAWADSVFTQMRMEADMDAWRGCLLLARGRAWLIVGSARAEELEGALENGDVGVLEGEEAEEAREGLVRAIGFFERARESGMRDREGDGAKVKEREEDEEELRSLLAEALVTLANLTRDKREREELYVKAQREGGDLDLDLDMDDDEEERRMDIG